MTSITDTLFFLAQQTSQPASAPVLQKFPQSALMQFFQNSLISLGICALLLWVACRLLTPHKFWLRDTPGRPNRLGVAEVAMLYAALVLLGSAAAYVAKTLIGWYAPHLANTDMHMVIGAAISQPILIFLVLLVAHYTFRHGIRSGLGLNTRHWLCDTARGIFGVLAIYPVCMVLYWLSVNYLVPPALQSTQPMLTMAHGQAIGVGWKILIVVVAVLIGPVFEELFFRGILQSTFRSVLRSPWAAIILTSLIFAPLHFIGPGFKGAQNILPLFALSLALGYNYERCGRLWPSILIHMLFNAVNIAAVL